MDEDSLVIGSNLQGNLLDAALAASASLRSMPVGLYHGRRNFKWKIYNRLFAAKFNNSKKSLQKRLFARMKYGKR